MNLTRHSYRLSRLGIPGCVVVCPEGLPHSQMHGRKDAWGNVGDIVIPDDKLYSLQNKCSVFIATAGQDTFRILVMHLVIYISHDVLFGSLQNGLMLYS